MYQACKGLEKDIQDLFTEIQKKVGVKETETGLAPPSQWDLQSDKLKLQREAPLIVARCLKIYQGQPTPEEEILRNETHQEVVQSTKYIVNLRYFSYYFFSVFTFF